MRKIMIFILSILAITLVGCGGDNGTEPPPPATPPARLVVDTTVTAPTMSSADEDIWALLDSVDIEIGGSPSKYGFDAGIGKINVAMKAIKKDGILYVRARWRDNTPSLWANAIRKTEYGKEWEHLTYSGGEDELMILFDAGDNGTEKADCATMCHSTAMYTTGGGHADCWKWKSTTTYPGKMAEDEYWSSGGRNLDITINDHVYRTNWYNSGSSPYYMHVDTLTFSGPFLYSDDTSAMDINISWPTGYMMPGYYIDSTIYKSPTRTNNSRWDIRAVAKYDSTGGGAPYYWTVVMARALNTTHTSDDVNLTDADSVQVTMAISDAFMNDPTNAPGATVHSGSKPFYIILKP